MSYAKNLNCVPRGMLCVSQNGRHVPILFHWCAHAPSARNASPWREAVFVPTAYRAYFTHFGDVLGLYIAWCCVWYVCGHAKTSWRKSKACVADGKRKCTTRCRFLYIRAYAYIRIYPKNSILHKVFHSSKFQSFPNIFQQTRSV